MKRVDSMNDIALALGISRTTVSLCLSGKAEKYKISPETVDRVRRFAAESGFVPNSMAQSIGGNQGRSVGFLVGIDSFTAKNQTLTRLAIREFSKRGWRYYLSHFDDEGFSDAFMRMKGMGVAAVVVLGSLEFRGDFGVALAPYLARLPLYLLDYPFSESNERAPDQVFRIGIEREAAYREAFAMLFELGHRTFLLDEHHAKLAAFKRVAERYSVRFDKRRVLECSTSEFESNFDCGLALAREVLKKMSVLGATAVSLHDDELAAGVMSGLLDAGVSIPLEVSVFGFDNIEAAPHFRVPLSSINVPLREMVEVAASAICDGKKLPGDVVMAGHLVQRASIASASRGSGGRSNATCGSHSSV